MPELQNDTAVQNVMRIASLWKPRPQANQFTPTPYPFTRICYLELNNDALIMPENSLRYLYFKRHINNVRAMA